MLNENARKWVEALRSGEFTQCSGKLCGYDGSRWCYCCLGVACEIASRNGVNVTKQEEVDSDERRMTFCGEGSMLPTPVLEWLGLRMHLGEFRIGERNTDSLSGMNDSGHPFSEIADLIESEPEGLFA